MWHLWGGERTKAWHADVHRKGLRDVDGNAAVKDVVAMGVAGVGLGVEACKALEGGGLGLSPRSKEVAVVPQIIRGSWHLLKLACAQPLTTVKSDRSPDRATRPASRKI